MEIKKDKILVCTPLRFYTHYDEEVLFTWLNKIQSIKDIVGVGRELHLSTPPIIPNNDLLELMAIFDRYKFDSKQLRVFMNESNKTWFD